MPTQRTTPASLRAVKILALGGVVESVLCGGIDYSNHGSNWDSTCQSRDAQSPINLYQDLDADATATFAFKYNKDPFPSSVNMLNSDGRLHLQVPDGVGQLWLPTEGGEPLSLTEVAFRANSEHTILGKRYPLEVQMIHTRPDSDGQVIVSVLFDSPEAPPAPTRESKLPVSYGMVQRYTPPVEGSAGFNVNFQNLILDPLPLDASDSPIAKAAAAKETGGSKPREVPEALDLNKFLDGGTFLSYAGSLTAPPCTADATWFVRREVQQASAEQLEQFLVNAYFSNGMHQNYRAVQAGNQRTMQVYSAINRYTDQSDLQAAWPLPWGSAPMTDVEYVAMRGAKRAKETAQQALRYLDNLDQRIQKAANVRAEVIASAHGLPEAEEQVTTEQVVPAKHAGPSLAETLKAEVAKEDEKLRLAVTKQVDSAIEKIRSQDPVKAQQEALEAKLEPFLKPKAETSTNFLAKKRKH